MKTILLFLSCFIAMGAIAQDTIKKSKSVGKFDEQFMVLKSDKNVRQGSCKLFTDKKMVASGSYEKGKRAGVWSFYDNDILEQQYDYTNNKLISDIPQKNIICEIDDAQSGDVIKKAVIVGGYNGFKFMAASAKFDEDVLGTGVNKLTHVVSLDANGKITSWSASVTNNDGVKIIHPDYSSLPEEVALFLPATLNGQKTACTVTVRIMQAGESNDIAGPDGIKVHSGKKKGKS